MFVIRTSWGRIPKAGDAYRQDETGMVATVEGCHAGRVTWRLADAPEVFGVWTLHDFCNGFTPTARRQA